MIVLLQPPFLRCAGSHNDRAPLELCYASAYLTAAGAEHVVLNADATGTSAYVPWRRVFEQFELFKDAVDGRSPVYSETFERVMQYEPEVVVISAGDAVVPVLDCGNPWVGVRLSQMFRAAGAKTVGAGPFYGNAPDRFGDEFDGIVQGMCPTVLAQVVAELAAGGGGLFASPGPPVELLPTYERLEPPGQVCDYVMTSFGCPYGCDYCYAPRVLRGTRLVPQELVAADVGRKAEDLYIRDMIFPLRLDRLRELAPLLQPEGLGKRYTCDARADLLAPAILEALLACGVVRLKMGVEVLDDEALRAMRKGEGAAEIERGVRLAREFGMKIVLYVLLGGLYASREAYDRTYEFVEAMEPESVVVNVAAYQTFDRHYRYDAHFSPFAAMQWRVDEEVLYRFLALQDRLSNKSLQVLAADRLAPCVRC